MRLLPLLLLSGCILSPCMPVEVQRIVSSDGVPHGPGYVDTEVCRLVSVEPYDEWFAYGIVAYREVWECGCV